MTVYPQVFELPIEILKNKDLKFSESSRRVEAKLLFVLSEFEADDILPPEGATMIFCACSGACERLKALLEVEKPPGILHCFYVWPGLRVNVLGL